MATNEPQPTASPQNAQPTFQIEKLYVKDLSLEVPNAPQVFLQAESPQLEIQVRNEAAHFSEGLYEVVVTVTVTARVGEKTLFLAEAAQAGIFTVRGIAPADLEPLIAVGCPTILYPYVRETISDLVTRAGFPPVMLAPVSFEALYLQQKQQAQGEPRKEVTS